MNNWEDRWLYYVDDEVIHSLLQAEPSFMDGVPGMKERALSSPALVQAVSLFLEGRKAEAISRLEKAIAETDTEADAYSFLGGFYLEAQRYDQAAPVFEQALEKWLRDLRKRSLEEDIERYYSSLNRTERAEDSEWASLAPRVLGETWV